MNDKAKAIQGARALMLEESHGVLATQSRALPGYPFGSVVPYSLDREGHPVILISRIAQHTRNIDKDQKVSLTVVAGGKEDVQTGARLTWLGEASRITDEVDIARHYASFPQARGYHKNP